MTEVRCQLTLDSSRRECFVASVKEATDLIALFRQKRALLEGHFLLTSGLHSDRYFQCALLLQEAPLATELGAQLAAALRASGAACDVVIGPALGGILVAHEVARALGLRSLFAERSGGAMSLRRGFRIEPGQRVLVVEDVVTTGGSVGEVLDLVQTLGGVPVAVGCLVDRSGGATRFPVPFRALVQLEAASYQADQCPLCRAGTPAVKPGSRS